ncbi:MAG: RimK family alpha-L-glutamate ligase [Planctomycetia bacterium]
MSLRVVILGEPTGWHADRLASAVADRGHAATIVPWRKLTATLDGSGESVGPSELDEADLVVVRGMPGSGRQADRLEEVIFRMNLLGRLAGKKTVINSPRSLEVAIDKHLSLCRIAAAGVPVPDTIVVQDVASAREGWERLGCDCLLKPLFGSRGRGIVRIRSPDALEAAVVHAGNRDALGGVFYLQRFIDHPGWDARILLVGEQVFAMRRRAAEGQWCTNISSGGIGEPFVPPADWVDRARQSAEAVGAEIAGIDLLPTDDGGVVVLEVNGVPGWRGLEGATGADVTGAMVRYLEGPFSTPRTA